MAETPRAVFGLPLISLRKSGQMRQGLPLVLTHTVEFLEKHCLDKTGLFRLPGSMKRCQELRRHFNEGGFPEFQSGDVLTSASLLKSFIRELPGGLIPEPQGTQLLKVYNNSNEEDLNQAVRKILRSLPEENFNVLCYILFFLSRVADKSHLNLMTTDNLSIVFGPTIFHVPLGPNMLEQQGQCNALTRQVLDNLPQLLPDMYPHAYTLMHPSSNTAEERDWTSEECELLPLTEIRSELLKIGRLGRLRKGIRGFWRKLFSCAHRSVSPCALLLQCHDYQRTAESIGALNDPQSELSDQDLFWGADQYDFSIMLRAGDVQCYWHFAHFGENFYLNFMVQLVTGVALDRHLSVTVNAPSGLIVGKVDNARGQIAFNAKETGFYQMCFSNFHNRFGSMQVFLHFGVYYEGQKEEEKNKKEEDMKQINNTLSFIQESSNRLQRFVFHMWRHYNYERMRRGADFYLLQSNSTYVNSWSAVQSLVIITAGYLQLYFLKRLFKTKPAEGDKPRC
ncbi:hypothetical protein Q8A67_025650 [Cirrhinus molitorella]|uniref:Uncharacterized protein n=2 Tax=Cirrhinus molitorella TaxID=172907 RepID=A0AA88P017_9TELE|nr:hypothetical protein Q8A67_025650 [Cirrhinus molitorella]